MPQHPTSTEVLQEAAGAIALANGLLHIDSCKDGDIIACVTSMFFSSMVGEGRGGVAEACFETKHTAKSIPKHMC